MASTATSSIYQIEQIARLPNHLKRHIVEQHYDRYSPVDHAVWRYIMRKAFDFHSRHAHRSYVDGLQQTGIGLDRIPRVEEMNAILGRIGWGAAPVCSVRTRRNSSSSPRNWGTFPLWGSMPMERSPRIASMAIRGS